MISAGNILPYLGTNTLVLKLIVLTLPLDFFFGLLHNLSVNGIGASSLKVHAVFPFIMESVSGKKKFIFCVQCITLPLSASKPVQL
jgi:hypothetical protein